MKKAASMHEQVARLRRAGLRVTGPRLAILAALEQDPSHPTAERLYERLRPHHPSLSLSTVYETLETFIRTGLCRRVHDGSGRLRVDGTTADHDHAVCRECGTIFDVSREVFPLPAPPTRLPDGLEVTAVRVEYEVICAACRRQAPQARRRGGTKTAS
ncbi:MAG: transcriptional repressor [Candidatus Tectimicrobiota bacterium]|nr:MAG: transcriptional repressor [Candidatus Tectomicrobia bacterium]